MDEINVDEIVLENTDKGKFMNIFYRNEPIVIETIFFPVPFGLEESYNNKFIKLSLKNIKNSLEAQELYTFIKSLEKKLEQSIPDCDGIQSQLRITGKYDPILTVKIPMGKNAVIADVIDSQGAPFNIYGLSKGDMVKCKLLIDTVWYFKGKYSYKIKAKEIIVDRK